MLCHIDTGETHPAIGITVCQLFPPCPAPATLTSIYMRSIAVLKSSDSSFSKSWRSKQSHFLLKKEE